MWSSAQWVKPFDARLVFLQSDILPHEVLPQRLRSWITNRLKVNRSLCWQWVSVFFHTSRLFCNSTRMRENSLLNCANTKFYKNLFSIEKYSAFLFFFSFLYVLWKMLKYWKFLEQNFGIVPILANDKHLKCDKIYNCNGCTASLPEWICFSPKSSIVGIIPILDHDHLICD